MVAGLSAELLAPETVAYITDTLAAALNQRLDERPRRIRETEAMRDQARQRLQRLVDAIQDGVAASTVAGPIAERQAELERLEGMLAELGEPLERRLAVMPTWVRKELDDLVGLLSGTPERTKAELQRLALRVTMTPVDQEQPRVFYRANVESALPCLSGRIDMRSTSGRPLSGRVRGVFATNTERIDKRTPVDRSLPRPKR
jgi:hypothetical protein